jgi:hypothetical protein
MELNTYRVPLPTTFLCEEIK